MPVDAASASDILDATDDDAADANEPRDSSDAKDRRHHFRGHHGE
jgi:hypothetical protein